MPWRVDVSPRARRELASLGAADRAAMNAALERLATDPTSVDFKKLAGGAGWRLRVGSWRAIVSLNTSTGTMLVQRVLNRRDAYR
jgi:mRNA-degrading endonuclease RelE of RelBE toxin-antitoxin system